MWAAPKLIDWLLELPCVQLKPFKDSLFLSLACWGKKRKKRGNQALKIQIVLLEVQQISSELALAANSTVAEHGANRKIQSLSIRHSLSGVWCRGGSAVQRHRSTEQHLPKRKQTTFLGVTTSPHCHQIFQKLILQAKIRSRMFNKACESLLKSIHRHSACKKSLNVLFFFFFWADPRAAPVVHLIPFVWWHKRSRGRAHNNMEKVEDTLHRKGVIAGCNGSVQVENGKY